MELKDIKRVAYCAGMDPEDYKVARDTFADATLVDFSNYDKTYAAVAEGVCDVAVMPFEASDTGGVNHVLDLMFRGNLCVNNVIKKDTGSAVVRYAVMTREAAPANSEYTRFMIMFTVKDEPGCLVKALSAISTHGYNMHALHCRPVADLPWHYYFYVEADGDDRHENGQEMLAELEAACESVKVLGRYVR